MADYIIVETFITLALLSSHINIFSSACLFLFSDGYDTPCCKDCLYTNTTGTKCRDADPTNCQDNTYCDGKSPRCPSAPSMRDGTRCIDRLVRRARCLMYSLLIWQGVVKHDFTQQWLFVPRRGGGWNSQMKRSGMLVVYWHRLLSWTVVGNQAYSFFRTTPRFFFFRDLI